MSAVEPRPPTGSPVPPGGAGDDDKSDLRVVMQFFIVPLVLVAVLVLTFFGLQVLRTRRPDPAATLRSLQSYRGFLSSVVGDLKRWQYGYDLSLLMRGEDPDTLRRLLPDLIQAFDQAAVNKDLKLRRYLALALGHSGDRGAAAPLTAAMRDPDPVTRTFCAWGLARVGDRASLSALRQALADDDAGVRMTACYALGVLQDRGAAGALRGALQDGDPSVRWNAALALSRLGDPAGEPLLIDLLRRNLGDTAGKETAEEERSLALNAIRGLVLLRTPAGRAALEGAAANATDPQTREAARLGLQALASSPAGAP
jgi:HEAT repeat protein